MPQSNQAVPSNWPSELVYLHKPFYSPNVPATVLTRPEICPAASPTSYDAVSTLPVLPAAAAASPSPLVCISRIMTKEHPAYRQHGLFASRQLAPGSFILCYLGWTHAADESDPQSSYDLALDRELGVSVDATRMGNEARFINDYRGVKPLGPNAEFRDVLVRIGNGRVERRVGVFVKPEGKLKSKGKKSRARGIAKGEEILVSYGKGFWANFNSEMEEANTKDYLYETGDLAQQSAD